MRTMKGTKGGQKDWLKGGGEDAWGWRGRVVETVACGTMRCSFLRFVNVSSFFLISRVEVFLILQSKILDLILISFFLEEMCNNFLKLKSQIFGTLLN